MPKAVDGATVATREIGRALPEVAVGPFVDVDLVTENRVSPWPGCLGRECAKLCKDCETATGPEGPVKILC